MPDSAIKCRILVIDDMPDVRDTVAGALADAGHAVTTAANERDALHAIMQEPFDFAVIDVRLHDDGEQDESGLSLAIALSTLCPDLRTILCTRYAKADQIVRALRYYGAVSFVDKKEKDWVKQLDQAIAKACQEEPRQPSWARHSGETARLTLSLASRQPLGVRAFGQHVCSLRSEKLWQVPLERYARRANIALSDPANRRFHITNIGMSLWEDLFADYPQVLNAYLQAYAKSPTLSLLFETPSEFLQLPIEFTRVGESADYLALRHPLSRFAYNTIPKREAISPDVLAKTDRLRILLIASNTDPTIDEVDNEVQALCDYLRDQDCLPIDVKVIPTEQATYDHVREEIRSHPCDILHYAGHGIHEHLSPDESSLFFWAQEDKQGDVIPMTASELGILLEDSDIRFVYLSCCFGAAAGNEAALLENDYLGLTDAAAKAGVPSVLGFRWPVLDSGASQLALAFYKSLLEQGHPDIALWRARRELAAQNKSDTTWLSPILIHQQ